MNNYLNFAEISKEVKFKSLLDFLNLPYKEKDGELIGNDFIITIDKNLYFNPKDKEAKGSVINFYSNLKGIGLREAAQFLKDQFFNGKEVKKEIPDLELHYCDYLAQRGISPEVAKQYNVGLVKQRSIVAGRIAFKVNDYDGNLVGYVGFKQEDNSWFFPKGFKRPVYLADKAKSNDVIIVVTDPFDALHLTSIGYPMVTSLLGISMTEDQETVLKKFKRILLLHKEPQNISGRLVSSVYIKCPLLKQPLKDMSDQDIHLLIKS
ncbi:MAG: hypothetical protein HY959_03775 [Ignavibacteriae bacterium]|nr:hypothetical protein [Ignavibacteriota bacterium]